MLDQRDAAATGDGHQRSFHNVLHRNCPLGASQDVLGDEVARPALHNKVLNPGPQLLARHNEVLHKSEASIKQLHSVVVPIGVPLVPPTTPQELP